MGIVFGYGEMEAWDENGDGTWTANDKTAAINALARALVERLEAEDPKLVDLALGCATDRLIEPPYVEDVYELLGDSIEERALTEDDIREVLRLRDAVLSWVGDQAPDVAYAAVLMAQLSLNFWSRGPEAGAPSGPWRRPLVRVAEWPAPEGLDVERT